MIKILIQELQMRVKIDYLKYKTSFYIEGN